VTRVLIVEDEADIRNTVAYNLEREGMTVVTAGTGDEAMQALDSGEPPDLVLLDLMLPDVSGLEICRRIRQQEATRDVPVIILTAKGEEIDRVVGFEVGADDYVVKPFSVRELLLRVRAVLRRADVTPAAPERDSEKTRFGILEIDEGSHKVWVEGSEVRLTALEFRLLTTFIARRGRVQTREGLLSDVWGIQADITTRTVDTHVKRLREKIGGAGVYIETLRGVGYRFREDPNEAMG